MSMYHEGYEEALHDLETKDDAGLYDVLDALFGREDLPDEPTHEDLLHEAGGQIRREFRDDSDPRWRTVDLFAGIHWLQMRSR